MIRALTAVGLSVAIPLGALSAPLVHAHVDHRGPDHHGARKIHAHVAFHSTVSTFPAGASLDDHEAGHAVYLQWFVAVAHASFDAPAVVVTACHLGAPPEAPARHSLHVAHGHDPPVVRSLSSRAPPFLS